MKLQRHITSKSYLFKVIVEHLMTLCWGIAETITAWVLNLLNLFMLPNRRKLELYWKANWANISPCSKKNPPQNLLITRGSIKSWWSPFCLHVAAASLTYSCKSVWKTLEKEQRKYSIFWESWVELILFRTTSCLNIPFVSAFFLFFFFSCPCLIFSTGW